MCMSLLGADSRSALINVSVKPEVLLSSTAQSNIHVRIRLSPSASARIWIADSCAASAVAGYLITSSGEYDIPLSALNGTGSTICLAAALDGLTAQVPSGRSASLTPPSTAQASSPFLTVSAP